MLIVLALALSYCPVCATYIRSHNHRRDEGPYVFFSLFFFVSCWSAFSVLLNIVYIFTSMPCQSCIVRALHVHIHYRVVSHLYLCDALEQYLYPIRYYYKLPVCVYVFCLWYKSGFIVIMLRILEGVDSRAKQQQYEQALMTRQLGTKKKQWAHKESIFWKKKTLKNIGVECFLNTLYC